MEDYEDFAVDTAKQIVNEETDKLYDEILGDLRRLMQAWAERLNTRITTRMDQLGIQQELNIMVTWVPDNMPVFNFLGATDTGVTSESD